MSLFQILCRIGASLLSYLQVIRQISFLHIPLRNPVSKEDEAVRAPISDVKVLSALGAHHVLKLHRTSRPHCSNGPVDFVVLVPGPTVRGVDGPLEILLRVDIEVIDISCLGSMEWMSWGRFFSAHLTV
jgi:hypothetical protein